MTPRSMNLALDIKSEFYRQCISHWYSLKYNANSRTMVHDYYYRAVGCFEQLMETAKNLSQHWIKGIRSAKALYSNSE